MLSPLEAANKPTAQPLRARTGREHLEGFVVVGLPFSSGDLLCLRHFPETTIGPAYDSLWHRSPAGEWTIYTSIAPEQSCPRFIGAAATRVVRTPVEVEWTGPSELVARVPAEDLRWTMRLAGTPITRLMNAMMAMMPAVLYRSGLVLRVMSWMSTVMLAAGRFQLSGHVPNRQLCEAAPRRIWMIPEAHASIAGRDFGRPGPLSAQTSLGDFALPQRGLFMVGGLSFEAYAPTRHLPIPAAQPPRLALGPA
jgi:hypothetical protein